MSHITFDNDKHRHATLNIAQEYENRARKKYPFYVPVKWEDLPPNCQQEHADIARAGLDGTTYHGRELPQWVLDIVDSAHTNSHRIGK